MNFFSRKKKIKKPSIIGSVIVDRVKNDMDFYTVES